MLTEKKSKNLTYETTTQFFFLTSLVQSDKLHWNPLTSCINSSFLPFSESLNMVNWLNSIKLKVTYITSTAFLKFGLK